MLKRMTERFNHSRHHGHSLSSPQSLTTTPTTPSPALLLPPPLPSSSSSSSSPSPSLQSPAQSNVISLTPSTSMSHSEYRGGSMSTQRTSLTLPVANAEWSKANENPEITEEIVHTRLMSSQRPRGTYKLTDFIIHRTLGTGSFGRVHLVRSKHNLRFYAVKVLNKERVVKMKQIEHTNNEQFMLGAVQHPFIINLWGTFQDCSNLYMVMDFVPGGELFTLLRRSNRFPDSVAKFYAAEVALALKFLHQKHIIYRDLKPENVLLNFDGHIKVADFGFAKPCATTTWTLCGTPDYLAPEVIQQTRYNKSVDWYALGVLIFEMLVGVPPFHTADGNHVVLYEKIMMGPNYIRWPQGMVMNAIDLIMKLMEGDPSRRYGNMQYGAGDVFAHAWFREVDWTRLENRDITPPYMPKISGEGDASAYVLPFDKYPEDTDTSSYGLSGPDPFGHAFPGFEYTSPS